MTNQGKQKLLVWWMLWFSFQIGIFIFYYVLGSGPSLSVSSPPSSLPWLVGAIPVAMSVLIRWGALPRAANAQRALTFLVVGIGMAEATCFLGLFLFPAHKQDLFILSALGVFQFIPFFARRFFD